MRKMLFSAFLVSLFALSPSSLCAEPSFDNTLSTPTPRDLSHISWIHIPEEGSLLTRLKTQNNGSVFNFNSLKILVWNAYKGGKENFFKDLKTLSFDKDLVLLQEGSLNNDQANYIQDDSSFNWTMATSFYDFCGYPTGVITMEKQLAYYSFALRSPDREPLLNTPKMTLVSLYRVKNQEDSLMVINLHGINFVSTYKFFRQMEMISRLIDAHKGPIILAGDFNNRNIERNFILRRLIVNKGLLHVDPPHGIQFFDLDHMFVRGFLVKTVKRLDEIRSSDHRPFVVELELLRH